MKRKKALGKEKKTENLLSKRFITDRNTIIVNAVKLSLKDLIGLFCLEQEKRRTKLQNNLLYRSGQIVSYFRFVTLRGPNLIKHLGTYLSA